MFSLRTDSRTARTVQVSDYSRWELFTTTSGFVLILFVFIAARLWRLTSYGLFGDEIFSFQLANDTWGGLMQSAIRDVVHPPLFYLLLKLWISIGGNSLLWVKLFPVLFSVAAIVPLVLFCRELKLSPAVINLALWLMAVNEFLVNFSQELRMYSPLLCFTLFSMWLFVRFYNSPQPSKMLLIALFAVNLALIFTHYYGWLVVGVEWLFLLSQRDGKLLRFSLLCVGLILCFSPWVYLVAGAARVKGGLGINLDWNNPPKVIDALWYTAILNGPLTHRWLPPLKSIGALAISGIFLYPLLILAWRRIKGREVDAPTWQKVFLILPMLAIVPVLISFLASQFLPHSVWGIRYLIIAAPAYLILLAYAALALKPHRLRVATVAFFILWSALSGFLLLLHRDKLALNAMVAQMVRAETSPQEKINVYTNRNTIGYTMQFYLEQEDATRFEVVYIDDYSKITDKYCWVAFIKFNDDKQMPPQEILLKSGYEIGKIIQSDTFTQHVVFFAANKLETE